MTEIEIKEYFSYLNANQFPCIGAKATLARHQIKCMVADDMACPKDDNTILEFLYSFVDDYRVSKSFYHSAAIIFKGPGAINEEMFDVLMWQRLQSLADLDAKNYSYDKRVNADPSSVKFSFSLKEEAFYIIGLHNNNSRLARQFSYPTLVFNPHAQFEHLRKTSKYDRMKNVIRKRDMAYSGSINPMLEDFGKSSEVYQYSGQQYDETWKCPLKINHATTQNNSSP
jgi:FPC/CPF motif-containing protein YcgG